MTCPLCGQRKARRACPALGQQICAVCCGSKRLTEIRCPSDCPYLTSSREHPPAVAVRQHQHDIEVLARLVRDLNHRQSQLFLLVARFLATYTPDDLHTLVDDDVIGAAGALASTYDTSAKGVIYEHRTDSQPAERLLRALKSVLAEAGQGGGTSFDRDAAVVLQRITDAARQVHVGGGAGRRDFVELVGRLMRRAAAGAAAPPAESEAPRLIVP